MNHAKTNPLVKVASALLLALVLLVFYILWTHSKNYSDWLIIYGFAFLVSLFFTNPQKFPAVTSKKVIYSVFYIFYLFYTKTNIFQTNFEVASPDFWFKSRVAKIDNLFFVDEDGLVERLFQRTPGYYAITSLEDFLVPSEADIIFDGGGEGFLIFEL